MEVTEVDLEQNLWDLIKQMQDEVYDPTGLVSPLNTKGAKLKVFDLVNGSPSKGYMKLYEAKRLDLTVEHYYWIILNSKSFWESNLREST